jgi:hypothetical protein
VCGSRIAARLPRATVVVVVVVEVVVELVVEVVVVVVESESTT